MIRTQHCILFGSNCFVLISFFNSEEIELRRGNRESSTDRYAEYFVMRTVELDSINLLKNKDVTRVDFEDI